MRALVIYESMYGNTHTIADAIAKGLASVVDVEVVSVNDVPDGPLGAIDLLVVGGPTHGHGMSRPASRHAAVEAAEKPGAGLVVEPRAEGRGTREWLESLDELDVLAAVFDTRVDLPAILTGRAATGISKRLRRRGVDVIVEPESFLVTKANELLPGEAARAEAWGHELGVMLVGASVA